MRSAADLGPERELTAVQSCVAEGDRQPQPGAADRAGPRGVRAPEPVEDPLQVVRLDPQAVVAHAEGDSLLVAVDGHDDRAAFAVLDGVAEQVADDAPDASRVHLDGRVAAGSHQPHVGAVLLGQLLHRADDVGGEVSETGRLEFELHRTGVVPADLEQVGQQRLEPLHLGVQQLCCAGGRRVEVGALIVDHVGGQPDRRQRRAQLVRDVRDESLLHEREVGELLDLRFDAVGHRIERAAERRQFILSAHRQSDAELARGELRAGVGRLADRGGDRAQHEPRDRSDQQYEPDAHDPQGRVDEAEGLRRAVQVVGEVQLVAADVGDVQLLAHHDPWYIAVLSGQRHRLPPLARVVGAHRVAQLVGDDVLAQTCGDVLRSDLRRGPVDTERADEVARGLLGQLRADQVHEALQTGAVALRGCGVQDALGCFGCTLRVGEHLVLARLEEVVLDRQRHPDAGDDDREGGEGQRDQDGAESQRTAPEARQTVRPRAPVSQRVQCDAGCRGRRAGRRHGST